MTPAVGYSLFFLIFDIYMADIAEINDMASERFHMRSVDDLQVFQ